VVGAGRAGFTLVEAIVALALSSVLVILVGTTFLVQNQYYAVQVERSAAQDNARMVTEMIASEVRSTMKGGVVLAANKRLVVRSPMALAIVCDLGGGGRVSVHVEGGDTLIDTDEVSGVALRDTLTAGWTYYDAGWSDFRQPGGTPARDCANNGADTVGATADFFRLRRLDSYFGAPPPLGSVLMLYRTVEYKFATSEMDPTTLALFRGLYGDDLMEFATGMSGTAQFRYRTGGSTYSTSVSGGALSTIDAIRIQADARRAPQTGGVNDVTFGWGVNVVLRNGG
jgi:type II secretory pathway pseudopilin PulG